MEHMKVRSLPTHTVLLIGTVTQQISLYQFFANLCRDFLLTLETYQLPILFLYHKEAFSVWQKTHLKSLLIFLVYLNLV